MPRGTWLESARAKAPWTVEDTAELLCALDHLTDSSDSRCSEKSVTIRKIQNLLKQRRTHAQIAGKITHILKQYGNNHTRRRPEVIYKVGSKCLSGLPAELKREMLRYSAVVRDMQVTRYLAIEKRLRSGSTRDGPSLSNPRASTTELCSSSPAKGNIQALESSQRIKSEQSPSELKSRVCDIHGRKAWSRSHADRMCPQETSTAGKTLGTSLSFPQRDTSRLFVTSVADTLDCDDVNTVIQGPDNELQDHDHQCSPLFTPPSPEYLVRQSAARSVLSYEDPNLFQQSLEGQTVEQLLSVVHELYSDNLVFRDQLSTAKGELEKLNASERRNISVSKILSGKDDESVRAVIDNQLQRINELEKDKRNQVLLKPFLSLQMGKPPPLDLGSLQRDFIHLKSSFRSLLTITAFRYPAAGLASHADGDVGALFRASLRGSQAVELVETHVPASRMVLSMIGSALHEWVYLAEVQCAATMATPLFHEYKYYVSSICKCTRSKNDICSVYST